MTANPCPVCARGCTTRDRHRPTCTCTPDCDTHNNHCDGCVPAPAILGRLCQRCTTQIRSDLRAIPRLTAAAAARTDGKLSPHRTSTDHTRDGTADLPSPSLAWDTAEETMQWALRTALSSADSQHQRGPFQYATNGVPDPTNITQLVDYILTNLAWFAAVMPIELHDEATRTRHGLEYLTGLDTLIHRIKEPCPSCNRRTLMREDGSDRVTCRNRECGRIWHEGEYEWLIHTQAG